MKKITLELAIYPEHPKGYSLMYPPSDKMIWDFILENIPSNKKYLKHLIRDIWIQNSDYENYIVDIPLVFCKEIPRGDLTYYIDIYVEDK